MFGLTTSRSSGPRRRCVWVNWLTQRIPVPGSVAAKPSRGWRRAVVAARMRIISNSGSVWTTAASPSCVNVSMAFSSLIRRSGHGAVAAQLGDFLRADTDEVLGALGFGAPST
ncbi:hypothetical protein ACEN8K_36195, partial [Variovorax sp. CT11-76]